MPDETQSLDEALKNQIKRVQHLVDRYASIPECRVTTLMMQADIALAKDMLTGNDVQGMIDVYESLCEWRGIGKTKSTIVEHSSYCTPWLKQRFAKIK